MLAICLAALLVSCTTAHVMVGHARPPVDPATVKVYSVPPKHYEEIARVASDSKGAFRFTPQGNMDAALERAKSEAASLGANGLLLQEVPHSGGMFGLWGSDEQLVLKNVNAFAIYVTQE